MRLSINADERALCLTALDLGDKQCDTVRKGLEALHVEDLAVMALQGRVAELRRDLGDTKRRTYEFAFDERRALAICLRIYRDRLNALVKSEAKLFVESTSTEDKINDIGDFLPRLAGQEQLFREDDREDDAEVAPAAVTRADAPPAAGAPLSPRLGRILKDAEPLADPAAVLSVLETLAGACEIDETKLSPPAFDVLARSALRLCALVVPAFDGTRAGAHLMQEMVYDDVNAIALASWIRAQIAEARLGQAPRKLSTEGINEIRRSLSKDAIEPSAAEARILAEHEPRNPLDVVCEHCHVDPGIPCRSATGLIVGSEPHLLRMRSAGCGDGRLREVGNALYTDAVLLEVFGRIDDEIRTAVKKHRSIAFDAKWVQTLLAGAPAGGPHAHA
jgi:hypothetical protein